jgi:hypothetical protein
MAPTFWDHVSCRCLRTLARATAGTPHLSRPVILSASLWREGPCVCCCRCFYRKTNQQQPPQGPSAKSAPQDDTVLQGGLSAQSNGAKNVAEVRAGRGIITTDFSSAPFELPKRVRHPYNELRGDKPLFVPRLAARAFSFWEMSIAQMTLWPTDHAMEATCQSNGANDVADVSTMAKVANCRHLLQRAPILS